MGRVRGTSTALMKARGSAQPQCNHSAIAMQPQCNPGATPPVARTSAVHGQAANAALRAGTRARARGGRTWKEPLRAPQGHAERLKDPEP
jgi:hypothetical protein